MQRDPNFETLRRQPALTLPQKFLAVAVAVAVFALALIFSVVLFAAVVTAGTVAWGYLWWKTRALRRRKRNKPPAGLVIEGEIIREVDDREERPRH